MILPYLLLIPLVVALLSLLVRPRWLMEILNVAGFMANLVLGLMLLEGVLQHQVVTAGRNFLRADALSAWMVLLISMVSLVSVVYAGGYFRHEVSAGAVGSGRVREFYVLTPLVAGAMFLVVLVDNLGVMWVALEVTALASVLLVALNNRKTSLEAAWKYVIIGSFGLVLALFGTIFIYAAAVEKGSTASSFDWSELLGMAGKLDPRLIKLAFIFALIGYGTKAGLAPMHTWLPDAYSEAPSPTSAMLSGVSLKIAIYALLRFHILTTHCLHSGFSQNLLLIFGLFSMLLAGPFILVQKNLKRLFAYSSLEHAGLICTGFAINAPLTIFGALLHMGYHALTKPVLFFASGNIQQRYHTLEMRRIGSGLFRTMPGTAWLMALAVMAIIGLPPFGLFTSELIIIAGGFAAKQALVSSLVLATLMLVFCGMIKQISPLLFGVPKMEQAPERRSLVELAALILPLGVLLCFGAWLPDSARQLLEQAARLIGGEL